MTTGLPGSFHILFGSLKERRVQGPCMGRPTCAQITGKLWLASVNKQVSAQGSALSARALGHCSLYRWDQMSLWNLQLQMGSRFTCLQYPQDVLFFIRMRYN
jgi:hypothetical protein